MNREQHSTIQKSHQETILMGLGEKKKSTLSGLIIGRSLSTTHHTLTFHHTFSSMVV